MKEFAYFLASVAVLTIMCPSRVTAADDPTTAYYTGKPPVAAATDAKAFRKWRNKTRDARCKWWANDRFGMFIHWGPSAVYGGMYRGRKVDFYGEWILARARIPVADYRRRTRTDFNPVKYDPEAWVALAREAGMKYIVITAKHCDGFALYDSKVTDWDVVDATVYGKDLLRPLAAACRKQGMKLGFYYSQSQDWVHPGGAKPPERGVWDKSQRGSFEKYVDTIAVPQVRELLTGYGPVGVLWWDTPSLMSRAGAARLYPVLREQPHIVMNNRLGGGFPGDHGTREQHIPKGKSAGYWETCMTMNGTWGYRSWDHHWKSTQVLARHLVDIVSKGGNFLLNVGPKADGTIPAPCVQRLKEIGAWMRVNGESIQGCGAADLPQPTWGRITAKPSRLYLHVFAAPKSRELSLPGLAGKVKKAWLLADAKQTPLKIETVKAHARPESRFIGTAGGIAPPTIRITLPKALPVPSEAEGPDPIATVIAVELDGK